MAAPHYFPKKPLAKIAKRVLALELYSLERASAMICVSPIVFILLTTCGLKGRSCCRSNSGGYFTYLPFPIPVRHSSAQPLCSHTAPCRHGGAPLPPPSPRQRCRPSDVAHWGPLNLKLAQQGKITNLRPCPIYLPPQHRGSVMACEQIAYAISDLSTGLWQKTAQYSPAVSFLGRNRQQKVLPAP